jgi:hypothetical protein
MTAHIIYRYDLDILAAPNVIPMPEGATILHVDNVNDQLAVWARVKPDARIVQRRLAVVGTGDAMAPESALGQHVGSAVLVGGRVVAHVFDLGVA